jgi:pimeloyl-ACP methyl ester carboxylesterase
MNARTNRPSFPTFFSDLHFPTSFPTFISLWRDLVAARIYRVNVRLCLGIVGLLAPVFVSAEDEPAPNIAGVWQGTLDLTVVQLPVVVKFKKNAGGGFTGTMDSPDQDAFDLPIDEVTALEETVKFTVKKIGGSYEGKVSADGQQIDGTWRQSGESLELVLKPDEKVAARKRPQEPRPPYPYHEEEVSYENQAAGIKIAGTLTLPRAALSKQSGPFPAVLLITGAGPQDRNAEVLGHKPFKVWADYLTRRGIAVLRVDDRGVGGTGGEPGEATIEDHAGDALAGVAYLKTRSDIDHGKIGLLGHSEGGLIAPAAAVKSSDVAFIVMLAGPGIIGEQVIYSQVASLAKAIGVPAEMVGLYQELQKKLFAVLKENPDSKPAAEAIARLFAEIKAQLSAEELKALEATEGTAETQSKNALTPWFRHFLTYDPQPALQKVNCSVLAICGEKDLQVDPKLNLQAIEAALKTAGNRDVTIKELPGLNHLFQASQTGALSAYRQIEETINPAALELVGAWLAKRTAAK